LIWQENKVLRRDFFFRFRKSAHPFTSTRQWYHTPTISWIRICSRGYTGKMGN
jgi:hypothetical protein